MSIYHACAYLPCMFNIYVHHAACVFSCAREALPYLQMNDNFWFLDAQQFLSAY